MEDATAYLEEKGIYGLVEYLLADLMVQQPAQPFDWLADRLLQLQKDNTDATTVSRPAHSRADLCQPQRMRVAATGSVVDGASGGW